MDNVKPKKLTAKEKELFMKGVKKAAFQVINKNPFMSNFISDLNIDETLPFAMGTDSVKIYINPHKCIEMDIPTLGGVLIHEAGHGLLMHIPRAKNRDHKLWNIATDITINNMILDGDFGNTFKLPEWVYKNYYMRKYNAEQIYRILLNNQQGKDNNEREKELAEKVLKDAGDYGDGNGDNSVVKRIDAHFVPKSKEEAKRIAEVNLSRITSAKMMGNIPANINRAITELTEPKIDWKTVLKKFMSNVVKDDYGNKFNHYYMQNNIYLKTLHNNSASVVVAVDTSGSISNKEIMLAMAEVKSILNASGTKLKVIYCDSEINKVVDSLNIKDIQNAIAGGGGTDFRPVFEYLKSNSIRPDLLIYFTDLYGSFPKQSGGFNTLWITTSEGEKAPFGKTLCIKGVN